MRKIILAIVCCGLVAVTVIAYASTYSDNERHLREINQAIIQYRAVANAYFNGFEIDGYVIPATQAQKDSLKNIANALITTIKTYADSLELYSQ